MIPPAASTTRATRATTAAAVVDANSPSQSAASRPVSPAIAIVAGRLRTRTVAKRARRDHRDHRQRVGRDHARPSGQLRADQARERPRLHERLLHLGGRVGVPHDPAADPQVQAAVGDRERADREAEVEVAVGVHDAERAHRRAPADRLDPGDVVDGRELGRPGDRAAGEGRPQQLGQPDARAQRGPRRSRPCAARRPSAARPGTRRPARCPGGIRGRGRCARGRRS